MHLQRWDFNDKLKYRKKVKDTFKQVMRDPFEERLARDKEKPQLNSPQEQNYWGDSKTKTRARAEYLASQKDVRPCTN